MNELQKTILLMLHVKDRKGKTAMDLLHLEACVRFYYYMQGEAYAMRGIWMTIRSAGLIHMNERYVFIPAEPLF